MYIIHVKLLREAPPVHLKPFDLTIIKCSASDFEACSSNTRILYVPKDSITTPKSLKLSDTENDLWCCGVCTRECHHTMNGSCLWPFVIEKTVITDDPSLLQVTHAGVEGGQPGLKTLEVFSVFRDALLTGLYICLYNSKFVCLGRKVSF